MNMNLEDLPPKLRRQAEAKIAAQMGEKVKVDERVKKDRKNDNRERQDATAIFKDETSQRKYKNQPCTVNGIRFDSKKEAERYSELMLLLRTGQITDLRLQHHFTLAEAFTTPNGASIRKMEYIADFTYTDSSGKFIVEDVKSEATRKNPVYAIKKKLMAGEGYEITEV